MRIWRLPLYKNQNLQMVFTCYVKTQHKLHNNNIRADAFHV